MAFEKFHFGDFTGFGTPKLWSKQGMDSGDTDTNLPLFSSTETSENQVRADLQLLFSQLKEGLNKILGHVVNAVDQTRKSESLLVSEKAVVDYMTSLGNGDMSHAVYDSDEAVKTAGGIKAFVNSSAGAAITTHANNTNIHTSAAEKATWNSKANGTHSHAVSDVTNLQTALDGKAASGHTHNTIGNNLAVTGNLSATGTISGNALIADKLTGLDTDLITQDSSATNKKYVDDAIDNSICTGVSYGTLSIGPTETTLALTGRHTAVAMYTVYSDTMYGLVIPLCALNADSYVAFSNVQAGSAGTGYKVLAKLVGNTLYLKRSSDSHNFTIYGI